LRMLEGWCDLTAESVCEYCAMHDITNVLHGFSIFLGTFPSTSVIRFAHPCLKAGATKGYDRNAPPGLSKVVPPYTSPITCVPLCR
jgi:hypothetical protein